MKLTTKFQTNKYTGYYYSEILHTLLQRVWNLAYSSSSNMSKNKWIYHVSEFSGEFKVMLWASLALSHPQTTLLRKFCTSFTRFNRQKTSRPEKSSEVAKLGSLYTWTVLIIYFSHVKQFKVLKTIQIIGAQNCGTFSTLVQLTEKTHCLPTHLPSKVDWLLRYCSSHLVTRCLASSMDTDPSAADWRMFLKAWSFWLIPATPATEISATVIQELNNNSFSFLDRKHFFTTETIPIW